MKEISEISKMYLDGCSFSEIEKVLKVHYSKILKALSDDNIEQRSPSDRIKNYWKKNPDRHPWKSNSKFTSKPCENFKSILKSNNIKFIEEYSEFEDHVYSIDVALPEHKIGFEINGNQHYNKDGSLKEYYQKRTDYIEGLGWKLYQIYYTLCYNEELVLKIVTDSIKGSHSYIFNYEEYLVNKLNSKKSRKPDVKSGKCCSCGKEIYSRNKRCRTCEGIKQRVVERPSIEQLIKDADELGYSATGRKYGVSYRAIKNWIYGKGKSK